MLRECGDHNTHVVGYSSTLPASSYPCRLAPAPPRLGHDVDLQDKKIHLKPYPPRSVQPSLSTCLRRCSPALMPLLYTKIDGLREIIAVPRPPKRSNSAGNAGSSFVGDGSLNKQVSVERLRHSISVARSNSNSNSNNIGNHSGGRGSINGANVAGYQGPSSSASSISSRREGPYDNTDISNNAGSTSTTTFLLPESSVNSNSNKNNSNGSGVHKKLGAGGGRSVSGRVGSVGGMTVSTRRRNSTGGVGGGDGWTINSGGSAGQAPSYELSATPQGSRLGEDVVRQRVVRVQKVF